MLSSADIQGKQNHISDLWQPRLLITTVAEIWPSVAERQLTKFFVSLNHTPFTTTTGFALCDIVGPPCTAHPRYFIITSRVDHHQEIKLFSHHANYIQLLSMINKSPLVVVPSLTLKGQLSILNNVTADIDLILTGCLTFHRIFGMLRPIMACGSLLGYSICLFQETHWHFENSLKILSSTISFHAYGSILIACPAMILMMGWGFLRYLLLLPLSPLNFHCYQVS